MPRIGTQITAFGEVRIVRRGANRVRVPLLKVLRTATRRLPCCVHLLLTQYPISGACRTQLFSDLDSVESSAFKQLTAGYEHRDGSTCRALPSRRLRPTRIESRPEASLGIGK